MDPASIAPAIDGADAVLSAVGPRGEEEIRDSYLDWTIFRPPSLTGKAATGAYRTAIDRNLSHGFTVSRADLAACMLAMLGDPATVHRHVAIAS
jgi:putative NADH-flavin reductase